VQQALEALDNLYLPGELERVNAAITALRSALAIIKPEIKGNKTWKRLSDQDISDAYIKWDATPGVSMADFARDIEKKLRAKNSTLACIPAVPPG
jgi:Zn-finger domain-containing protein